MNDVNETENPSRPVNGAPTTGSIWDKAAGHKTTVSKPLTRKTDPAAKKPSNLWRTIRKGMWHRKAAIPENGNLPQSSTSTKGTKLKLIAHGKVLNEENKDAHIDHPSSGVSTMAFNPDPAPEPKASVSKWHCLIPTLLGRRRSNKKKHKNEPKDPCDRTPFLECPDEIICHIFELLPKSELLQHRLVCSRWKGVIDGFFKFHTELTVTKLRKLPRLWPSNQFLGPQLNFNSYTVSHIHSEISSKALQRLSSPSKLNFEHEISSTNFLRMLSTWTSVRELKLDIFALHSLRLFQKWRMAEHPLEYFPHLINLKFKLDLSKIPVDEIGYSHTLRQNMNHLLMTKYPYLAVFSYYMINCGPRVSPCSLSAPILLFAGRHVPTLTNFEVVIHTGLEISGLPRDPARLHLLNPYQLQILNENITVHRESNFGNLESLNLARVEFHVAAISGCKVCDNYLKVLQSQTQLQTLILETQVGISLEVLKSLLLRNHLTLTTIEVTVDFGSYSAPTDLSHFSGCSNLKTLRVRRVEPNTPGGARIINVECGEPSFRVFGLDALPTSITQLYLSKTALNPSDIPSILERLDSLKILKLHQCEVIDCDDGWGHQEENHGFARTILDPLWKNPGQLKVFQIDSMSENQLKSIVNALKRDKRGLRGLLESCDWEWLIEPSPFFLHTFQFYQIVFYKDLRDTLDKVFKPYYFVRRKL